MRCFPSSILPSFLPSWPPTLPPSPIMATHIATFSATTGGGRATAPPRDSSHGRLPRNLPLDLSHGKGNYLTTSQVLSDPHLVHRILEAEAADVSLYSFVQQHLQLPGAVANSHFSLSASSDRVVGLDQRTTPAGSPPAATSSGVPVSLGAVELSFRNDEESIYRSASLPLVNLSLRAQRCESSIFHQDSIPDGGSSTLRTWADGFSSTLSFLQVLRFPVR